MTTNTPTLEAVRCGAAQVAHDLAEAEAAFDRAAYDAAKNPTDATRLSLADARRKVGELRAEQDAVAAVARGAERQSQIDEAERVIAGIQEEGEAAIALVDAVIPAFRKFYDLAVQMGSALDELLDAEAAANQAAQMAEYMAVTNTGEKPFALAEAYHVMQLVNPLLWLVLKRLGENLQPQRSEAVMDVGGKPQPERTLEALEHGQRNAHRRIEAATRKRLAVANERRAAL